MIYIVANFDGEYSNNLFASASNDIAGRKLVELQGLKREYQVIWSALDTAITKFSIENQPFNKEKYWQFSEKALAEILNKHNISLNDYQMAGSFHELLINEVEEIKE